MPPNTATLSEGEGQGSERIVRDHASTKEGTASAGHTARGKMSEIFDYMMCGGTAGMIARTCVAPVERVKIMYQVNRGHLNYISIPRTIVQEEGVLAFWKGNSAAVIRVIPYFSIQFVAFEEFKQQLCLSSAHTTAINLVAGSLAGLTATTFTYPLDLVRAKLAVQEAKGSSRYRGVWHALTDIPRKVVPFSYVQAAAALYRGYIPTILGVIPYAGLKFMTYELIKTTVATATATDLDALHPSVRVGSGALAGLLAQTCVYPFDVIRRRKQTCSDANNLSTRRMLYNMVTEEGISKGLYRGLTLNWAKTVPNVAIYLALYDHFKLTLKTRRAEAAHSR